ncbi:hypothetical protein CCH79_00017638 [Gambusia affinis]|uniref:Uncharacterized protein n=1 Tax=Gambusia affinis TaxID=33528 RepID=A0A315W196_GAMAF|nr:hypothetical protein CCH79_00017638 [Gambusia affinis]
MLVLEGRCPATLKSLPGPTRLNPTAESPPKCSQETDPQGLEFPIPVLDIAVVNAFLLHKELCKRTSANVPEGIQGDTG